MVEWKKIEDLGPYFGGLTGKTKEDFVDGNAKFITYMNVFANASLDITSTGVVRISDGEKQNKIQKGDILFTGSSETPDEAGMSCVVTEELNEDYYMNSFCFGIRLNNPEQYCLNYLKHILRSSDVRKSISKSASGVTRFNISKARFGKIQIPLPSLEEQTRIVGILDTFTASIDNLKEQIAQRRKQYEYYRDELLDFPNDNRMVWKLLGSVFPFIRNGFVGTVTPYFTNMENGVRYLEGTNIHNGTISDNTLLYVTHDFHQKHQKSKLKADDILMVQSGHIGECAIVGEKYQGANCHALIIMSNGGFCNSKFIVHYFHTYKGLKSLSPAITGGAIKHVLAKKVGKILVPVPSLEEQSRIVSILDTFEASIQNLEQQLAQREKQYEYYRNKLLTFE